MLVVDTDLDPHTSRLSAEDARALALALHDGSGKALILLRLDSLLGWLIRPDAAAWAPLNAAILALGSSREQAVEQAFALLDECVLRAEAEIPERVLGLPRDADLAIIKQRYRRLIAVYHPDRHTSQARDCHVRTDRINRAYRALRRGRASVVADWPLKSARSSTTAPDRRAAPPPRATGSTSIRPERRKGARRADPNSRGRARRIQRRLVQVLLVGCVALVAILLLERAALDGPTPDRTATASRPPAVDPASSAPVGPSGLGSPGIPPLTAPRSVVSLGSDPLAAVSAFPPKEPGKPSAPIGASVTTTPQSWPAGGQSEEAQADRGALGESEQGLRPSAPHSAREIEVAIDWSRRTGSLDDHAAPLGPGGEPEGGPAEPRLSILDGVAPPGPGTAPGGVARGSTSVDPCVGVDGVLEELRRAYRSRSADRIARLFTLHGRDRATQGRETIRAIYANWFRETHGQEIRFSDLSTRSQTTRLCRVDARFDLSFRDGSGRLRAQSGEMLILVEQTANGMLIEHMGY
jgi:hypothetical protein